MKQHVTSLTRICGCLALALLAAACETSLAPAGRPPGIEPYEVSRDASAAQSLVGSKRTDKAAAAALRLSGAQQVRWVTPGEGVTADYNSGRVNLEADEAGRILGVSCG
jgi:hypothetical protein